MKSAAERDRQRADKVKAWISVIVEVQRDLELDILSRRSETASETGTDPDPRLRPCEHRQEWQRGRLCLACDNTGIRPATPKEQADGLAYDPYLIEPKRDNYAVTRDQSESSRRARDLAQLDASIESLERAARMREGKDVAEGETRRLRLLAHMRRELGRDGLKVLDVLVRLQALAPEVYRAALSGEDRAVAVIARATPGKLRNPV